MWLVREWDGGGGVGTGMGMGKVWGWGRERREDGKEGMLKGGGGVWAQA